MLSGMRCSTRQQTLLLCTTLIRASLKEQRQQHHENIETGTPSAYWKGEVYIPFLDHLLSEVNELLVKPLLDFQPQNLTPGTCLFS